MKINYEIEVWFTTPPEWRFDTKFYTLEEALKVKEVREEQNKGYDTKFRIVKVTREPMA